MFYCPQRATAIALMARSTMLAPTATIGQVRLVAPMLGTSTSIAAIATSTPTTEQTETLFVALRILI